MFHYTNMKNQLSQLGVIISLEELSSIDYHIEIFIHGLIDQTTRSIDKDLLLTNIIYNISTLPNSASISTLYNTNNIYYHLGLIYFSKLYAKISALFIMSGNENVLINCNKFIYQYYVPSLSLYNYETKTVVT